MAKSEVINSNGDSGSSNYLSMIESVRKSVTPKSKDQVEECSLPLEDADCDDGGDWKPVWKEPDAKTSHGGLSIDFSPTSGIGHATFLSRKRETSKLAMKLEESEIPDTQPPSFTGSEADQLIDDELKQNSRHTNRQEIRRLISRMELRFGESLKISLVMVVLFIAVQALLSSSFGVDPSSITKNARSLFEQQMTNKVQTVSHVAPLETDDRKRSDRRVSMRHTYPTPAVSSFEPNPNRYVEVDPTSPRRAYQSW